MTKIYIYRKIEGIPYLPELYPVWGVEHRYLENQLTFKRVFDLYQKPFFEIVNTQDDCDFILIPHIYKFIKRISMHYLNDAVQFSIQKNRPLLLFAYGDDDSDIVLKNTVVFRYSQYRNKKRQNEIIIPLYAPDGSLEIPLSFLDKHQGLPTVGFCGFAEYSTKISAVKAFLKNLLWEMRAFLEIDSMLRSHKGGIYIRKRALFKMSHSSYIRSAFIVRNFFSSHKETIRIEPTRARREFLDNITENDFSLTMRGDGNASMRFYEALSLARIPVVIDTDGILPLEDIINYNDFCLSIPFEKLNYADKLIQEFYEEISPEDFLKKQKLAREVFEKYLRSDRFYKFIFSRPEEILKRVSL